MRWVALLGMLAGCDALFGLDHLDDPPRDGSSSWLGGYAHRKRLTIDATGDLADFPVLVARSDADLAAHADTSGRDIVFTDGDGTVLAYEIVSFGTALEAWVNVPKLSASPTDIFMYYGGPLVQPTSPWGSRYIGVWHMSDDVTLERDRSAHVNDLAASISPPAASPGIAGRARSFVAATQQYLCSTFTDGLHPLPTSFSYSFWANIHTPLNVSELQIGMEQGGSTASFAGYDFEVGAGGWGTNISDGSTFIQLPFGVPPLYDRWQLLLVTMESGMIITYLDGRPIASLAANVGTIDPMRSLCFGGDTPYAYVGAIDEPRLYGEALSPRWISAEYANLSKPDTFVIAGVEETAPK